MPAKWIKQGETILGNGEKDIKYTCDAFPGYCIVSKKRAIKHANRIGYWMHTEYEVRKETEQHSAVKRCSTLKAAKEAVESGVIDKLLDELRTRGSEG